MEDVEHVLHCPSAEDFSVVDREVGREHALLWFEEFDQLDRFGNHYVALLPLGIGAPEERYFHVDVRHRRESLHSVPVLLRIDLLNGLGESAVVDDDTEIRDCVKHISSLLVLMRIEHELKGRTCLFHYFEVILHCLLKEAIRCDCGIHVHLGIFIVIENVAETTPSAECLIISNDFGNVLLEVNTRHYCVRAS